MISDWLLSLVDPLNWRITLPLAVLFVFGWVVLAWGMRG